MRSLVRVALAVVSVGAAVTGVGGCKKEAKLPPPPTPEQVKSGVEQSAERVRNNPNLTPQQKEQALRLLEGMAAAAEQQKQTGNGR
jgi:hypothetical protein